MSVFKPSLFGLNNEFLFKLVLTYNSTDEKSRSADTKVGVREFAETGSEGIFRCGDILP